MTFKPGKYKTRDGCEVVVLCDDAAGPNPLLGYIVEPGERGPSSNVGWWNREGKAYTFHSDGSYDLMPPEPEQVTTWCVLWVDGSFGLKESPHEMGVKEAVAVTRVVLKPGQFDDENTPDPYTKGWNDALKAAVIEVSICSGVGAAAAAIRALKKSAP